jgi:hypothetical protein
MSSNPGYNVVAGIGDAEATFVLAGTRLWCNADLLRRSYHFWLIVVFRAVAILGLLVCVYPWTRICRCGVLVRLRLIEHWASVGQEERPLFVARCRHPFNAFECLSVCKGCCFLCDLADDRRQVFWRELNEGTKRGIFVTKASKRGAVSKTKTHFWRSASHCSYGGDDG